jgi:hypothetical protein
MAFTCSRDGHLLPACIRWALVAVHLLEACVRCGGHLLAACVLYDDLYCSSGGHLLPTCDDGIYCNRGTCSPACVQWPLVAVVIFWQVVYDLL